MWDWETRQVFLSRLSSSWHGQPQGYLFAVSDAWKHLWPLPTGFRSSPCPSAVTIKHVSLAEEVGGDSSWLRTTIHFLLLLPPALVGAGAVDPALASYDNTLGIHLDG